MRYEFAVLLAFALLLAGCVGSAPVKPGPAAPAGGEGSVVPIPEPQPLPPAAEPEAEKKNESAPSQAGNATAPAYVNYCHPTYWKGTLSGTAHNDYYYNRCGEYDYSVEISVRFTVPFDLAAYLARKDFNFNDCPGMPPGAADGSRDMSIDGKFNSTRTITSQVTNRLDRMPDTETTSTGALYVSQPYGLALATYPRQQAQNASWKPPHLVLDRCTWDRGIQTLGYDEAVLLGADAGNFSFSSSMREVFGMWVMNNTVAGTYALERTN